MKSMYKKFTIGIAAVALLTTGIASGAMAAEDDVTTKIQGTDSPVLGEISATSFTDSFLLTGLDQEITGAAINAFTVTDARGVGAGWQVTVEAGQFTDAVKNKTLTKDALSLSAPLVDKSVGASGSSDPKTITTSSGNIGLAPVKVLAAAEGTGMGTFDISAMDLALNLLPKDVYAGNYTSTVTVSIVSGPQ